MRACTSRQVGMCGLCGAALKKWVDAQVVMGVPTFDAEMAAEDAEDAEIMSASPPKVMPNVHAPPVVACCAAARRAVETERAEAEHGVRAHGAAAAAAAAVSDAAVADATSGTPQPE